MKIFLNALVLAGLAIALLITTKMLEIPNQEYQYDSSLFLYDKGNAEPEIRAEILDQLKQFQNGYDQRDTTILSSYMDKLFSRENILILGTMPGEIYSGYEEAADLVSSDWLYWGDVSMQVESANISASDSVAWFSMIGHVVFDLSSWLELPLRVSGIMVQEDKGWLFQQLQFQFDLDISGILLLIVLLSVMLLLSTVRLVYIIFRSVQERDNRSSGR